MLPNSKQALAPAPRFLEVFAGLVLGLFALALSAAAIYMSFRIVSGDIPSPDLAPFVIATLLLSLFCSVTAFRLTRGKGRKRDGGLFPPWLLRVLGLSFIAASGFAAYQAFKDREYRLFGIASGMIGLGLGGLYLASSQQRKSEDQSAQ